jgi:hypothetical protein
MDKASTANNCVRFNKGILKKDFSKILFGDLLLGVPMLCPTYTQEDGDSYLLCLTTTSAYQYNPSTLIWDDITEGIVVDNCEAAWTAKTNVTCAQESVIKRRDVYSLRLTLGTSFTTGIAATYDFAAKNLSTYDHIHLYIRSSISISSGQIQFLLDNSAVCASPLETLNLPALTANTWTRVSLPLASPASLTAIISIGLSFTADVGAGIIYLDDIRAVKEFTGTEDDIFSSTVLNDTFVFVNGKDMMKTYDGTTMADITGSPPFSTARAVIAFQNRVLVGGPTESGELLINRLRWTSVGTLTTWTGGTSGWVDVLDTADRFSTLALLRDKCFAYMKGSIIEVTYVGGTAVFKPVTRITNRGCYAPRTLVNLDVHHIFYSIEGIYKFDGLYITHLADPIRPLIYETGDKIINQTYSARACGTYIAEVDEYWIVFPTGISIQPNTMFKCMLNTGAWVRRNTQAFNCFGVYRFTGNTITWTAAVGTWAEATGTWRRSTLPGSAPTIIMGGLNSQVYEDDRTTLETGEDLIYETKDFIFGHAHRFVGVSIEARYGPFYASYSLNGGVTWSSEVTFSYKADWTECFLPANNTTRTVRVRIRCSVGELEIRLLEPWYLERQRSKSIAIA